MIPTCPDCVGYPWSGPPCPMSWDPLFECWSCLRCLDLPIRHWVVVDGRLEEVRLGPEGVIKVKERP